MDNRDKICEALDKIRGLLLEFEKETIAIISCNMEDILPHTEKRVELTQQMDGYFSEIEELCGQFEDGEELYKIIKNVSSCSEVKPEYEQIFSRAQRIFSLGKRIKDSDIQALDRINREKDGLIKKIREINTGQTAKASKFKVGMETSGSKKHLGTGKII